MESLRNRINVKLVNNKKRKTKSKVTLTLKKQAYVDMCILDLSKAFCMNFVIILKINMVTTQDNSLIV